jgi:hypothetical protein
MPSEVFIIDADALIAPYQNFYPFDIFPDIWDFFAQSITSKRIIILDKVYDEIAKGGDSLSKWLDTVKDIEQFGIRDGVIINNYSKILNYIQNSPLYQKDEALNSWSSNTVADPWIIAVALANSFTVITFERANESLSEKQPSKKVKIPDICKHFNVKCEDLYYMMRQLGFKRTIE